MTPQLPGADGAKDLAAALLAASPDAVIVVDANGRIESTSGGILAMFGYRPEELVGQLMEILIPEEVREAHVGHRTGYIDAPTPRPMGVGLPLLARRRDGTTFPVDVSLAPVTFGGTRRVGAYVRDVTERRRGEAVLRHVNEITQDLLAGRPTAEILTLTAGRARSLVGATTSWIVTPGPHHQLVVAAAEGEGAGGLVGATLSGVVSHSARAMTGGQPVTIADLSRDVTVLAEARLLDLGPGVYLPLMAEGGAVGALVVARLHRDPPFDPTDLSVAQVFASAAGVVLALGRARQELEAIQMTAEHERIARDLHDTVIQHLFAIGMGLQGVRRLADETVASRIDQAVEALDTVIRDIRETIFDLNRTESTSLDLRQRIRQIVADATHQLGFPPHVSFHGPVETVIDEPLAGHLLAVLREALSNSARHSRAASVEVTVSVDATFAVLRVADDGVGLTDNPRVGNGLTNMAERARQLGGSMEVGRWDGRGAEVHWKVPLVEAAPERAQESRGGA